jgi:hypothetical protein
VLTLEFAVVEFNAEEDAEGLLEIRFSAGELDASIFAFAAIFAAHLS